MAGTEPPLSSSTRNRTSIGFPPRAWMTSFMRRPSKRLGGIGERNEEHALPGARGCIVVVPVGAGDAVFDFVDQSRVQARIFQPAQHRLNAALMRPWRDDAGQIIL